MFHAIPFPDKSPVTQLHAGACLRSAATQLLLVPVQLFLFMRLFCALTNLKKREGAYWISGDEPAGLRQRRKKKMTWLTGHFSWDYNFRNPGPHKVLHRVHLAPKRWVKEVLPIKMHAFQISLHVRSSESDHAHCSPLWFQIHFAFFLVVFFIFSRCRDWLSGHNILLLNNISGDCLRTQLAKLVPGPTRDFLTL